MQKRAFDMKKAVAALVILVGLSSCSQYSCPTYDGYGGRSYSASTKKSKSPKGKEPYYKSMKRAEQ